MHAAINEPFVLSSYGLPKGLPRCTGELKRGPAYVYSTFSEVKNLNGYTTITVNGDGVHVLDVSTLHPVATHTLGPATTFSCPAVSSTTNEDGTETYAVIESSSELDSEESGRTIWMWRHHIDGDSRKKHSTTVSHKVSRIFLSKDSPSKIFLLSPTCDLSVIDADLTFKSTLQPGNDRQELLKSFIFSRNSCSFIPSRIAPTQGSIFLLIFAMDDQVYADIVFVGQDDGFVRLGKRRLPLDKESTPDTISSISCSDSGHLSVLTRPGSWHSLQLESVDDTINVTAILEPIRLTSLSALTPGANAGPSTKSQNEISLLALHSTFVLLAGVTRTPSREIVLLLWDLQYSVVLATHTIPIPSTLSQTDKKGLTVELVAAGAAQAMLVLTPTTQHAKGTGPEASSSLRSTVLVVPFTIPAASTIANAMGLASHSQKWLLQDEPSPSTYSDLDATQLALLQSMRTLIKQNRPEGASTVFFEWSKKTATPKGQQPDIALGHEFVKELLDIVLQPAIRVDIPYSSKVLQFLLSRRAVSACMVEGGLLHALKLRNDWQSISLALDAVSDIPEVEIIALLQSVVAQHRKSATIPTDDAMQIDSTPSDLPSLTSFLSSCVSYATSPAPLRLAIRQYLLDVEDLACVLEALSGWVARAHSISIELLPTDVVKNAKGVMIAKPATAKKPNGPPLEKVLSFLQTLLDASFLALLQHSPLHDILRRIASDLEPELARVEDMEQLRGPLEPFASAQMKALREGIEGRKDGQIDWRKRRKAVNAQTSVAVGLYRLEELVI